VGAIHGGTRWEQLGDVLQNGADVIVHDWIFSYADRPVHDASPIFLPSVHNIGKTSQMSR